MGSDKDPEKHGNRAGEIDIARAGLRVTQYMSRHGISGGVALGADHGSDAAALPGAGDGRKYEVIERVAQGGMGVILSARELDIRRTVAMKVMRKGHAATAEQVVRFIEEAQVTGQLEHPNIVPVYELGADAEENLFYTMKMVRGVTLKDIVSGIAEGKQRIIARYPLAQLLTIFQKACDAVAFAHARGVVHRDLKPENIMIGDYGEVLVMDWGLAKVLRKDDDGRAQAHEGATAPDVDSLRFDDDAGVMMTMDGQVLGTPMFMAPEQALGKIELIDARTDIYALGAILYNILALRPPVAGRTVNQVLLNVSRGNITPPSALNQTELRPEKRENRAAAVRGVADMQRRAAESARRARGPGSEQGAVALPHCPANRVPSALSAVAMKALALDQQDRYQSVSTLQEDIEAYRGGFATTAEDAGLVKQLALLVKRHRREFCLGALSVAVMVAMAVGFVFKVMASERRAVAARAQEAEQRAAAEEAGRKALAAGAAAEEAGRKALAAGAAEARQRVKAEQALRQAEVQNYYNSVALADSKIPNGQVEQAEALLWGAPERLRGWEWGRLLHASRPELLKLRVNERGVLCLAFSPDGGLLVTGGAGPAARLWDVKTGECRGELTGHSRSIRSVAFSADGKLVATTSDDKTGRVWDAGNGAEVCVLRGHSDCLTGIALSPTASRAF